VVTRLLGAQLIAYDGCHGADAYRDRTTAIVLSVSSHQGRKSAEIRLDDGIAASESAGERSVVRRLGQFRGDRRGEPDGGDGWVPSEHLGDLEPVQVSGISNTITNPFETHTVNQGGGSSVAAKLTPLSEVTWLIFGTFVATNLDEQIPLTGSHASSGYSNNSHQSGW
jgi:hypothetical protein